MKNQKSARQVVLDYLNSICAFKNPEQLRDFIQVLAVYRRRVQKRDKIKKVPRPLAEGKRRAGRPPGSLGKHNKVKSFEPKVEINKIPNLLDQIMEMREKKPFEDDN